MLHDYLKDVSTFIRDFDYCSYVSRAKHLWVLRYLVCCPGKCNRIETFWPDIATGAPRRPDSPGSHEINQMHKYNLPFTPIVH
jgi:hypothetical protein